MASRQKLFSNSLIIILVGFILAGCSNPSQVSPTLSVSETAIDPAPSDTPTEPTPKPVQMGLIVNGEAIPLVEIDAELSRLQAALRDLGKPSTAEEQRQMVLDELISQLLLVSAANKNGYISDDTALSTRVENLASEMGGSETLSEWQSSNGYTPESFMTRLRREVAADWQKSQIYASVPETADQVHARQILVFNEEDANVLEQRLAAGIDFATLAFRYDPITGGDLGWFPRGYLTVLEVEDAAFSLAAGEVSPIIQSQVGYHVIQVIEKDPQHLLSTEARQILEQAALETWIVEERTSAQIEILLP